MDKDKNLEKQLNDLKEMTRDFSQASKDTLPTEKVETIEKIDDFAEGDQILKDIQERFTHYNPDEDLNAFPVDNTFFGRLKPFLFPIFITLFALVLTILLLYFFSKSRNENALKAITNNGGLEVVEAPSDIVIVEEPEPEVATPTPEIVEPVATPTPIVFENGTTTEVNVNFSYDKFNYDNFPRGIYLNRTQKFEGDYEGYKINASNRSFANDFFFGRDRYMVSLIEECNYVVDEATILVSNFRVGNKSFTGKVEKIIDSSKPRIVCPKY